MLFYFYNKKFKKIKNEILSKFGNSDQKQLGEINISNRSTLIVEGENVKFDSLDLDGTLVIQAVSGANVHIKKLKVHNKGWEFVQSGV